MNVLVATDGSEYGRWALDWVAALPLVKPPRVTVARRNVSRVVERMREQSQTLDGLVRKGRIAIVGAMYDVVTGKIKFLTEPETNPLRTPDPV